MPRSNFIYDVSIGLEFLIIFFLMKIGLSVFFNTNVLGVFLTNALASMQRVQTLMLLMVIIYFLCTRLCLFLYTNY